MHGNFLDRLIAAISPAAGARRIAARAAISGLQTAHYDGAAVSWRTRSRRIDGASANVEILQSLTRLRDVSRDLVRNNAYAASAVERLDSNIIGAGIIPSITAANKRTQKAIQALIEDHLDKVAIDYDGRNNWYGLQSLAARTMIEAGEALIVRYLPDPSLHLPVPLQIRVLDPEYLDTTIDGPVADGGVIFQGIEFDHAGRRVAYHIFDAHPGGSIGWRLPQSKRVPVADVVHLYRVHRPGQQRGLPWGSPIVMTVWDLADYEDAELMRQKVAACFAVFLKGASSETLAQQAAGKTAAGTPVETIEPGMIKRLPLGTEAQFATPPVVTGYDSYTRANQRKVGIGFGVPYEILTGDWSQTSFIAGRAMMIQFNRDIDKYRWHIIIPHLCDTVVGQWFLQAAAIVLGQSLQGVRVKHTPPRKEMIEPTKEIAASRDAIRSGLSSRSNELRELGHDPEAIETEIAEENKRADALRLRFDSDGRNPLKGAGAPTKEKVDEQEPPDQ